MSELKITVDQMKNYLDTGLKFVSLVDEREDDFEELNDSPGFDIAFDKGSIWEFVGWSNISLPLGEGEFEGELLKHPEFGFYRGNYHSHKPLMFRLSDLDKFIHELGFVPIIQLAKFVDNGHHSEKSKIQKSLYRIKVYTDTCDDVEDANFNITGNSILGAVQRGYENCYVPTIQRIFDQLFKWNFWIHGDEYFEQGLVIDKMKSNNSPTT